MKNKFLILILVSVSFLIGCNSYNPKEYVKGLKASKSEVSFPDYNLIQNKLLQPYCVYCHSTASGNGGGVNLETYQNVKNFIDSIHHTSVVSKTMPPGKPLPADLQLMLTNWVAQGAPMVNSGQTGQPAQPAQPAEPANPEQAPVLPPAEITDELKPTFKSLTKNVFGPKCLRCHGSGELDYDNLIKDWVVPGDAEKSALYDSIVNGRMPRKPLDPAVIEVVKIWIMNGAKND